MINDQVKTAFIIEDDTDICTLLTVVLKIKDINSVEANTIEDARFLFPGIKPDLIFVDHRLPDGFGFEFIPELRKQFPYAIIIAMTAQHSSEMEALSMDNGVDYYLSKPFQISKLNILIESVLC